MLKLNKTTEYGLIALRHLSRKRPDESASAREIADEHGLPFEITAKTLQKLKDTGILQSAHGARGGYTVQRPLDQVTLAEFLRLMEGPVGVVSCVSSGASPCDYEAKCGLSPVMSDLNDRMVQFLSGIRLSELTTVPSGAAAGSVAFVNFASLQAGK